MTTINMVTYVFWAQLCYGQFFRTEEVDKSFNLLSVSFYYIPHDLSMPKLKTLTLTLTLPAHKFQVEVRVFN